MTYVGWVEDILCLTKINWYLPTHVPHFYILRYSNPNHDNWIAGWNIDTRTENFSATETEKFQFLRSSFLVKLYHGTGEAHTMNGNGLFFLSLANIFSLYSKIFREIIEEEDCRRKQCGALPKDLIYLPSDNAWRESVYYRLLDVQKKVNKALDKGMWVVFIKI